MRFVAKRYGRKWGVYDRKRGSWPVRTSELGEVRQETSEADAEAEADRLNAHPKGSAAQSTNPQPPEGP